MIKEAIEVEEYLAISHNMWGLPYSKDEGSRVNPLNGHQWTPKDCKNQSETWINKGSN